MVTRREDSPGNEMQRHAFSRNSHHSVRGSDRVARVLIGFMHAELLIETFDARDVAALHQASLGDE